MKKFVKTLLLICLILLNMQNARSAEIIELNLGSDYLITSDDSVSAMIVANPTILTLSPFFTIFNEKNVILLHPQKVGKTNITLFQNKIETTFQITIKPKTNISCMAAIKKGAFEIELLDCPPQFPKFKIDIDKPEQKKEK